MWMDGKWSRNSFLLGSSCLANHVRFFSQYTKETKNLTIPLDIPLFHNRKPFIWATQFHGLPINVKTYHKQVVGCFLENIFTEVWTWQRSQKESGFILSSYHKAVVISTWRGKANQLIDIACHCYDFCVEKTFPHIFFECNQARHAWFWALTIMSRFRCNLFSFGPWMGLLTGQYLFGDEDHPKILKQFINVGWCLRGFVL
jgi:hypothetical protein